MFKKPSNPIISLLILFVMLLSGVMQVYAAVIPTVTTQPALTTYYRAINIDYTKVPNTDQTDFPFLFFFCYNIKIEIYYV